MRFFDRFYPWKLRIFRPGGLAHDHTEPLEKHVGGSLSRLSESLLVLLHERGAKFGVVDGIVITLQSFLRLTEDVDLLGDRNGKPYQ